MSETINLVEATDDPIWYGDFVEKVTITEDNLAELQELVGAVDLRQELALPEMMGEVVSIYLAGDSAHPSVQLLVVHNSQRAGIYFGADSDWGDWDEASQRLTLDDGDSIYEISQTGIHKMIETLEGHAHHEQHRK